MGLPSQQLPVVSLIAISRLISVFSNSASEPGMTELPGEQQVGNQLLRGLSVLAEPLVDGGIDFTVWRGGGRILHGRQARFAGVGGAIV